MWALHFNLKDQVYQVLALNGGIAAYIYVVPNGKLRSGQRAKHIQRLYEAVPTDDLRPSHVLPFNVLTCDVFA